MRIPLSIILAATVLVLNIETAVADPADEANNLLNLHENFTKRRLGSSYNLRQPSGAHMSGTGALESTIGLCTSKDCTESEWLTSEVGKLRAGKQKHTINIFNPTAGLLDLTNSQWNTNLTKTMMESPQFKLNAAQILTEPSVAIGVQSTFNNASQSLLLRYAAEAQMREQMNSNPALREIWARAYDECVASYIRNGKGATGTSTAGSAEKKSWIEAQSYCMGDRDKVASTASSYTTLTTTGFDFTNDPDHKGSSNKDEIKLSNYIFANTTATTATGSLGTAYSGQLKDQVVGIIGECTFTFGGGSSGQAPSARDLSYVCEPPTNDFQSWISKQQDKVFKKVMGFLALRCEHVASNPDLPGDEANTFCTSKKITTEELAKVSIPDYPFNCSTLNLFWIEFAKTNPKILLPKTGGGTNVRDCKVFTDNAELSSVRALKDGIPPGVSAVEQYSHRIALAQAYMTIIITEKLLDSLTATDAGGFKQFVRNFTEQLIADAIGGGDFFAAYQEVAQSLSTLMTYMELEAGKSSGQGTKMLTDGIDYDSNAVTKAGNTA